MITGPQCRAARALVEITRPKLALRSGVDEQVIEEFERMIDEPAPELVERLQATLEEIGAVFIEENGGGLGVRLKFTVSETRRILRLEGEGGIVGSDIVP